MLTVTVDEMQRDDPEGQLVDLLTCVLSASEVDASADYPCGFGTGTITRKETEVDVNEGEFILDYGEVWDQFTPDEKAELPIENILVPVAIGRDDTVDLRVELNHTLDGTVGVYLYSVEAAT